MNRCFAIMLCLVCFSPSHAGAQVMEDACATEDPAILRLFDATAFLVNLSFQQVVKNGDGKTYSLEPMGTYTNSPNGPLDPISTYYGAPQAPGGRTGVLIADDSVLTVAHQVPFAYTFFVYIFGLRAEMVGGICQYPDLAHIPQENVYFASSGADGQYNGIVLNTHSDTLPGDFVVITLDRPVIGRLPLPVRKDGYASPLARFAGVSFSQRLIPSKGDFAIQHIDESSPDGVAIANTSMMPGASGAPIYNLDEGLVETLVAAENSCVYFYQEPNGLYLPEQNCPGNFNAVNGPVTVISSLPGFHDVDRILHDTFEQ